MTRYRYHTATTLDGFLADDKDSLGWLFKQQINEDGPGNISELLAEVGAQVMGGDHLFMGPRTRARLAPGAADICVHPSQP